MLRVINGMRDSGVIKTYAIGGAMGAVYYLEAISTIDVDIFISCEDLNAHPLMPLETIFKYLRPLGYQPKGEHVEIEGELVQFLPADDSLLQEALEKAIETQFEGNSTRVMTAEHLMAIALRLGRSKDMARLEQFLEAEVFDMVKFQEILKRNGLSEKWDQFTKRKNH